MHCLSVRMGTRLVSALLLTQLLVCTAQDSGSKSRFDALLSKFGFGENPVALEQQKQGLTLPHQIKPKTKKETLKKDTVNHEKKKFSEALLKFGFGHSIVKNDPNTEKNENLFPPSFPNANGPLKLNPKRKEKTSAKRSKEIVVTEDFGLYGVSHHDIPKFPSILLKNNKNQPQLVQVVTSTFSPKHQITPRSFKQNTFGDPLLAHLGGKNGEEEKRKSKKIKKTKKVKKNQNHNLKSTSEQFDSTTSDPTLFVTPKQTIKNKDRNKKQSKQEITKNKPFSKSKHEDKSKQKLSFSATPKTVVTRKKLPVDFGEHQLSTQKPRHSRQQDLEDKNNALAALFNVAGGKGKAKTVPQKSIQKKKKKVKKPTNLTENNILREGIRQSSRRGSPKKLPAKVNAKQKPFGTGNKDIGRDKNTKRLSNKKDPLASLFSVIKNDKNIANQPKSSKTRNSNIAVPLKESQFQPTPTFNPTKRGPQIRTGTTRGRSGTPKSTSTKLNPTTRKPQFKVTSTRGRSGKPTPRPNNISISTRRGQKPPTIRKQESRSDLIKEIVRSTTRVPNVHQNGNQLPTRSPQTNSRATSIQSIKASTTKQPQPIRSTSKAEKNNLQSINIKPSKKTEQGGKLKFDEILNKFGFGGHSTTAKPVASSTTASRGRNSPVTNSAKIASSVPGISIKPKSQGLQTTNANQNQNNLIPSTTPFTVFKSPSTKAPIQIPKKTEEQENKSSPTKKAPVLVRGKARRKPVSNPNIPNSLNSRPTPTSRGRGTAANIVQSLSEKPKRIFSSRQPGRRNRLLTKPLPGSNNVLNNLIEIAGSAESNPVEKASKSAIP